MGRNYTFSSVHSYDGCKRYFGAFCAGLFTAIFHFYTDALYMVFYPHHVFDTDIAAYRIDYADIAASRCLGDGLGDYFRLVVSICAECW